MGLKNEFFGKIEESTFACRLESLKAEIPYEALIDMQLALFGQKQKSGKARVWELSAASRCHYHVHVSGERPCTS